MPKTDPGRDILNGLIEDLTAIKRLPPEERILAIVPLLDRSGGDGNNAESRLSAVRAHAAREAAEAAGGQTALALKLGVTPQRINTIITGKTTSSRRRAAKTGAAGG